MVREPFLIQSPKVYQDDLHVYVLILFRQTLLVLAGGTLKRTGRLSFGQDRPFSTVLLEYWVDVYCQIMF